MSLSPTRHTLDDGSAFSVSATGKHHQEFLREELKLKVHNLKLVHASDRKPIGRVGGPAIRERLLLLLLTNLRRVGPRNAVG